MIVIILFLLHVPLDRTDPGRRGRYGVVAEKVGPDQFLELHVAVVAFDDLRPGLQGPDDLADLAQFVGRHHRGLVEQHDVAELHLLDDQVLDVVLVQVASQEVLGAAELIPHAQGVHDRHDAIQARGPVGDVFVPHQRNGTDRARDGLRFADAAGLDDDVVELAHAHDVAQLLDQVHLECAADAAVLQGDERLVLLAHDPVLLDQVGIDVDLSDIVDDDGEFDAASVGENLVDQGGLAAAEVAGQE